MRKLRLVLAAVAICLVAAASGCGEKQDQQESVERRPVNIALQVTLKPGKPAEHAAQDALGQIWRLDNELGTLNATLDDATRTVTATWSTPYNDVVWVSSDLGISSVVYTGMVREGFTGQMTAKKVLDPEWWPKDGVKNHTVTITMVGYSKTYEAAKAK